MALVKCPRCELNYILDGEKLCTVCRREVRGEPEPSDMPELCSECGEHPAVPGGELCLMCLKEMNRRMSSTNDDIEPTDPSIEIDSVSTMDEIELDLDGAEFLEDEDFEDEVDPDAPVDIDTLKEEEDADDDEEE